MLCEWWGVAMPAEIGIGTLKWLHGVLEITGLTTGSRAQELCDRAAKHVAGQRKGKKSISISSYGRCTRRTGF